MEAIAAIILSYGQSSKSRPQDGEHAHEMTGNVAEPQSSNGLSESEIRRRSPSDRGAWRTNSLSADWQTARQEPPPTDVNQV